MHELLSLPRPAKQYMQSSQVASGLPINSLPGWEHIPLNSKLPMLKCPVNQVIFSKSKIGENLLQNLQHEFNSSVREDLPEYNALHDPNLKPYFTNERNLVRLRTNGEITADNDVICTLKEFNRFRQELHKIHLYTAMQKFRRQEQDQRDRVLIAHADEIAKLSYENQTSARNTRNEVVARKASYEKLRVEFFKKMVKDKEEKFERIASQKDLERAVLEHKKQLRAMKIKQHLELALDLERKHLIALKKYFQHKNDRLKRQLNALEITGSTEHRQAALDSWNRRLEMRIKQDEVMKGLLQQEEERREQCIQQHREKYRKKWEQIQESINKKSKASRRKLLRVLGIKERKEVEPPAQSHSIFEGVLDAELPQVLKYSIDLENLPFERDEPMYKAATFIVDSIVAKFHEDLSSNLPLLDSTIERLDRYFDHCREDVVSRATQLIFAKIKNKDNPLLEARRLSTKKGLSVAFDNSLYSIGIGSYNINPNVEIKPTSGRLPTPKGSLSRLHSVLIDIDELSVDGDIKLAQDAMLFLEHLMAKFKRELMVGIGKRTFRAVQCHFENKVTPIRNELLELDKGFLVTEAAKSILSYAVNKYNFQSSLRLCIRALSADVIYYLQTTLMDLKCDPRDIPEEPRDLTLKNACDECAQSLKICTSWNNITKSTEDCCCENVES